MSLVFSIPGKTFLAGEYLALQEGPSLVFLSQPCFKVSAKKGKGDVQGIHPDSPAGLFMRKHGPYFSEFDLAFEDPYKGKGGFGASTAQFLGVYALWLSKEPSQQDMEKIFDFKHLLEAYYENAWRGQGQRPSGNDLLGQLKGSFSFVEKSKGLISVKSWPFMDLELHLLHTGNKVPTHEHLKDLQDFDIAGLETSFSLIREAFERQSSDILVDGVKSYAAALKRLGFTCEQTLNLLEDLRSIPGVRAAKGCGALGADVVMVLTKKDFSQGLRQYCEIHQLNLIASDKDISVGLQVQGQL